MWARNNSHSVVWLRSLRWQTHSFLSEDPRRNAEVWESVRGSLACVVLGRCHEEPSGKHTPDTEVQQDGPQRQDPGLWTSVTAEKPKSRTRTLESRHEKRKQKEKKNCPERREKAVSCRILSHITGPGGAVQRHGPRRSYSRTVALGALSMASMWHILLAIEIYKIGHLCYVLAYF